MSDPIVTFGISPESMERWREALKTVDYLTIGGVTLPVILTHDAVAMSIVQLPPWMHEYYAERARDECLMDDAVRVTGKPRHEIRTLAAQSLLSFDAFVMELMRHARTL